MILFEPFHEAIFIIWKLMKSGHMEGSQGI